MAAEEKARSAEAAMEERMASQLQITRDEMAKALEEQRKRAEPAEEPAAAPAPEVVEDPVVAAEDMESYEDSLANAPGHVEPEATPLDVAEELSKQFERNVGDETIREVSLF